jgi:hypothetical protein
MNKKPTKDGNQTLLLKKRKKGKRIRRGHMLPY